MRKMLLTIAALLALVVMVVLGLTARQPATLTLTRSIEIAAPPDKIFPLINDFKRWEAWSPWEKKDPAMKRTWGSTTSGKGAIYAWDGNSDVGQGSMEITESVPPSKVSIRISRSPKSVPCRN